MPPPPPNGTSKAVAALFEAKKRACADSKGEGVFKKQRAKPKHQWQSNIVTTMGKNSPQAEHELNVAITHLICALGLPFNLAETDVFKRVLLNTVVNTLALSYCSSNPQPAGWLGSSPSSC